LGEVLQSLVESGHKYDDLINIYTLDQLWLFYEKSVIIKRKTEYELGIIFANCMTLPLGGEEAVRGFEKFITSFLPESHKRLREQTRSGKSPKQKNMKQQVMSRPTVDVETSLNKAFSFMELPTSSHHK
jgi:hypothetical protein